MFETAPILLRWYHLLPLGLVVIERVAILRTSEVPPRQRQFASRRVVFRKIPSTGRCRCPVCRLATRCGWVGLARWSFCGSTSAPRTRATHPLTQGARTTVCRSECGFHWL